MRKYRIVVWLAGHRFASVVVALLAVTLILVLAVPFLKPTPPPPEKLDPQEEIGLRWIKPVGSEAAYAGNEACKTCHSSEYDRYIASPHARTLTPIAPGEERKEFGSTQTVTDDRNGVQYAVRKGAGKNEILSTMGSKTEATEARWAFGSGVEAWTYLAQNGPAFVQLRITYYPIDGTWNFTPGSGPGSPFHQPSGDPYTAGQAAACFGCHSTVLTGTRKNLDLAHSRLNVGCESCHGPCRSHIDSVLHAGKPGVAAAIVKPPSHDPTQILQLCGSCHRVPIAVSDENAAASTQLARFPGEALPRSRCFTGSAGKLSCITCHDPHQSTKLQQESSFEQKCLNCHSAPHGTTCTQGEKHGCINCHMPDEPIARKLPLRFHNHWIRREPYGVN